MTHSPILPSEGYIQRITTYYPKMSAMEKKVADIILHAPSDVIHNITVTDLAEQAGTSISTVVRFCRTIGFDGFTEFKYYIKKVPQGVPDDSDLLNSPPNAAAIKDKVVALTNSAVASTVMVMDNEQLENAINAIAQCRSLIIWGEGTASGVAQAAVASFVNMGIHALYSFDAMTALRSTSFMGENDVAIVINRNGAFRTGLQMFDAAKARGVKTIAITEEFDSPLALSADIVLCTALNDRSLPIMLPSITLCQHLTIQLLQVGVLLHSYDRLADKIDAMYQISELRN